MLFIKDNPKSLLAEKYRNLRTSIEYSSVDKKLQTIVVTSSEKDEGKSTVSANLAYILAQGEKKVLIVDCDLRKPTVHKKFQVSNEVGLTEVLVEKIELEKAIENLEYGVDVLTSGMIPPNPAEIVDSKAVENLFEYFKTIYDYIIIDTPPVGIVTDGVVLAGKADGTILVVRANKTKDSSVIDGYNELKKVNANVLGTVINVVETPKDKYGYYGYGEKRSKRNKKL
ncbi:MAG: CpsD/CapB family tyrosine-protein kinase [Sarcina sp.]